MSILLITYDFDQLNSQTDPVPGILGQYKHVRLSRGTYAIETDEKTRTVFNKIVTHVSENVHLLVVTLIKPFAGPVLEPVCAWLSKHLPED